MKNIPSRLSPEELANTLEKQRAEQFKKGEDGLAYCRACGGKAVPVTLAISVHDAAFSELCAGSGEVRRVRIPHCVACEGPAPDVARSCMHV